MNLLLNVAGLAALLAAFPAFADTARTGAEIVKSKCASCHETGLHGSPRIADRDAWNQRFKKGFDATVLSAIRGHGSMPARGGMADLTDAEFRSAVLHLYNPKGDPPKPKPPPALGPNERVVDGVRVLLGTKPVREGVQHVNITLRDEKTGKAIDKAEVEVRVTNPVMGADARKLARSTTQGVTSYGADFRVSGREPHVINVEARIPGKPRTLETSFDFRQ